MINRFLPENTLHGVDWVLGEGMEMCSKKSSTKHISALNFSEVYIHQDYDFA